MPALFNPADYVAALQRLLPRGRAWPRDPNANLTRLVTGLAQAFERLDASGQRLLSDAFPSQPVQLLPEWEATLGLPDPCAGESPTIQQRQAQVRARFSNSGGQSPAFFQSYALTLGYAVAVEQFTVFRAGLSRAGDPCNQVAWAYAFQVNVPSQTEVYFRAGASAAGEPLATWSNAVLECELKQIAPAHTTILFVYYTLLSSEFDLNLETEDGQRIAA